MQSDEQRDILLTAAREALANAYAPYSQIRVAAALLDCQGRVFVGCNVENSSYSLTICAERNALFSAIAQGAREFPAMAVVSDSDQVVSPCGSCRQVLWEFSPDMEIWFANPGGCFHYQMRQLLPAAFSLQEESRDRLKQL